jgi:chromate transporter
MSSSTLDAGAAAAPVRPRSLTDLFVSFTLLALQGFGGVLAVAQRELVEHKRWFTNQEFVEEWAVAQIMPGPNIINLAITLGARHFGWRGAAVSIAGLLTAPLVVVLALAFIYSEFSSNPHVAGALRGMGAVAAGLIIATGLKLMPAMRKNVLGVPLCAVAGVLAFAFIAVLRLPLLWVLLGLGGISCVLAYRKLGRPG